MINTKNAQNRKNNKSIVVLATYNEKGNLPLLVTNIFATVPEVDLLVIDDNSPDGTGTWVRETMQTEGRLFAIHRSGKLGLGTAVWDGIDYAVEHDYEYMINMDADFSHPVQEIPKMLEQIEQLKDGKPFDLVIGSRYISGGTIVGWPLRRRLMSRLINGFTRCVLGLKTKDNSGSFRCYRVSILKKLDRTHFWSTGYSFFEEILFRLRKKGARMKEIPIQFTERRYGQSKINGLEAFRAVGILFCLGVSRFFWR